MPFITIEEGLTIKVPTKGATNWESIFREQCFEKISSHDHTGTGKGVQITNGSIKNRESGLTGVPASSSAMDMEIDPLTDNASYTLYMHCSQSSLPQYSCVIELLITVDTSSNCALDTAKSVKSHASAAADLDLTFSFSGKQLQVASSNASDILIYHVLERITT